MQKRKHFRIHEYATAMGVIVMRMRMIAVAMVLSSLPCLGCWGTTVNLIRPGPEGGGMVPFGGVKQDLICMQEAAASKLNFDGAVESDEYKYPHAAIFLFCGLDLPFSFIGDLMTWPYVETYLYINEPIPVPPVTQAPPMLLLSEPKPTLLPAPTESKSPAKPSQPDKSAPKR